MMHGIPFNYIWRNLAARRLTTFLTALGMALVVYVFTTVLMMSEGLRATLSATGQPDNVVVIRRGSQTETQSSVPRDQAAIVENNPEVARDREGRWMASREVVAVIYLPKRDKLKPSNVTIRGTTPTGLALRPQVRIAEGRMFRPGTSEIIAGKSIATGFQGAGLGETLRFAQRDWIVVGVFDAGRTGFNSEVWGDSEQMMQAFRRLQFSSVIYQVTDESLLAQSVDRVKTDQRLTLEATRETRFYGDQSEWLATFINVLGILLTVIFSIGAVVGAAITMYASVANRVGEIGTLRALGFRRRSILAAFLAESLCLGLLGGLIGLAGASLMQGQSISTTNFQTFAEVAFDFRLTTRIVITSLLFSVFMGFVGGFLPAFRASRLKIVDALRAA